MRTLLLLPLLLTTISPFQNNPGDGAPVTVVSAKWAKTRQKAEKLETQGSAPAAAITAAD
jgi:hypothetical protein